MITNKLDREEQEMLESFEKDEWQSVGNPTRLAAQYISNGYQPIQLFRYNPEAKYIYIIAGIDATIEAIIYENGNWEFLTDE